MSTTRTATVTVRRGDAGAARREVSAYLPSNYTVIGVAGRGDDGCVVTIQGQDSAGWTLDGYVLPRLASGMLYGKEV
jgi:hypothetical protein